MIFVCFVRCVLLVDGNFKGNFTFVTKLSVVLTVSSALLIVPV